MTPPVFLVLPVALLAMSASAPLIRFAVAPALAIAFWRTALAVPVLLGAALLRRERLPLAQALPAGAFLAVHWIAWTVAVQRTTVANASILICTGTLWAALLSGPLLDERITRRQWVGLGLALVGVGLVATGHSGGRHSLFGDAMALLGSLAWVGYIFIGRKARRHASFWGYTGAVYLAAGLVILAAALGHEGTTLSGFDRATWLVLAGVTLFPTLLGHGSLNYLLRHIGPARLSLYTLAEPVLCTLVAWPLFGEKPTVGVIVGGTATLLGVALGHSGLPVPSEPPRVSRQPVI